VYAADICGSSRNFFRRNIRKTNAFQPTKARDSPFASREDTSMKRLKLLLPVLASTAVLLAGCHPAYYGPPPPPPPPGYAVAPLIQSADENGFRAGMEDGTRDLNYGRGYRPQADRKFHNAPGYDPALGPRGPYVEHFRGAYLRGYDKAFYRR
jgi:hypothetical protein